MCARALIYSVKRTNLLGREEVLFARISLGVRVVVLVSQLPLLLVCGHLRKSNLQRQNKPAQVSVERALLISRSFAKQNLRSSQLLQGAKLLLTIFLDSLAFLLNLHKVVAALNLLQRLS